MKIVEHGTETRVELVAAQQHVQIASVLGRPDWLPASGDAGIQMREQSRVVHAREREAGAEGVFVLGEAPLEKLERLLPVGAPCDALEEQSCRARLHLGRGRPR